MKGETLMLIGCAALGAGALALNLWVLFARLRKRTERKNRERDEWAKGIALKALREFLRAKLLAGGYGKHRAYHVTEYGALLAVDAADLQLAIFAGLYEFWDFVAGISGQGVADYRANPFAVSLDEIDLGDGKGDFTYIRNGCGESFVDAVLFGDLANPHFCARVTADDFKCAVVRAQEKAAKRGEGHDNFKD